MVQTLRLKRPVVAITGSAGKTTTKEMLSSVMQTRWRIFKTKANWNIYDYTKKNVQKIKPFHKAVVLEYGLLRKGDIRKHCQYIEPNIGIITNVGTAHIGNLGGTIKKVAEAKSELIHHMKTNGILVVNADEPNSTLLATKGFKGKIIKVGIKNQANYRAFGIRYNKNGMSFQVKLNGVIQTFLIPIYGRHNIYNALFAIAVSHQLKFQPQEIKDGLRSFSQLQRRLNIYPLVKGIKVIDDSFSANPQAVKAAIDVLVSIGKKQRIAVLGSMLELGDYSVRGHKQVGAFLAKKKVDHLYLIGKEAKFIGVGAIQSGYVKSKVTHFQKRNALHRELLKKIIPGSTILIKGSHGIHMNKTVDFLRRHFR